MSNLKLKVLSVFAWFFGVIFIATALGQLSEGVLFSSLLMLIGSCLLLPPVKRLISHRKPNLSKGKITIVGSILILISFILLPSYKDTEQTTAADNQAQSDTTDDGSKNLTLEVDEQIIEDEVVATEDNSHDEDYNDQAYEEAEFVESKRSKLPNPFLDFNVSIRTNPNDTTPIISFVSRNKEPLHIYDVVINDGRSCEIFGAKNERNGVVNFGEKFDLFIVYCSADQIVEVKVITEKGYNVFTFQ